MKKSALIIFAILSFVTQACYYDGATHFIPKNSLKIPIDSVLSNKEINETVYEGVIQKIEKIYTPILKKKGKKLNIKSYWNDDSVNAKAIQAGDNWKVLVYGGLARHKFMTRDSLVLVACHELGHHLGGSPRVKLRLGYVSWASNEGQADYWGALKCMRRFLMNERNIEVVSKIQVPEIVETECEKSFVEENDKAICIRTALAGQSLSQFIHDTKNISGRSAIETPDKSIVSSTIDKHPSPQCRLDTYFQASLCEKHFSEEVKDNDLNAGVCTRSLNYQVGPRPTCWFYPR